MFLSIHIDWCSISSCVWILSSYLKEIVSFNLFSLSTFPEISLLNVRNAATATEGTSRMFSLCLRNPRPIPRMFRPCPFPATWPIPMFLVKVVVKSAWPYKSISKSLLASKSLSVWKICEECRNAAIGIPLLSDTPVTDSASGTPTT